MHYKGADYKNRDDRFFAVKVLCGERNNNGDNSSVKTPWQRERKLVKVSLAHGSTRDLLQANLLRGPQGLDSVWFHSNFILVHVGNRPDL